MKKNVSHLWQKKKAIKKSKKPQSNGMKHVCNGCVEIVDAVDTVKGLCCDCNRQQQLLLNIKENLLKQKPDLQATKGNQIDSRKRKKLFESGYTRALKDVKKGKMSASKPQLSDSDSD